MTLMGTDCPKDCLAVSGLFDEQTQRLGYA
jgi:hypothetical protein